MICYTYFTSCVARQVLVDVSRRFPTLLVVLARQLQLLYEIHTALKNIFTHQVRKS